MDTGTTKLAALAALAAAAGYPLHRRLPRVKTTRYPLPVPEKFQLNARVRRIRQQLRDGKITICDARESWDRAQADYLERLA